MRPETIKYLQKLSGFERDEDIEDCGNSGDIWGDGYSAGTSHIAESVLQMEGIDYEVESERSEDDEEEGHN